MGEVENQEEISADAEHQCNTQSQDAPTIFEEFTCRICLFTDQHNAQIFGSETCNMDLVDKMSRHLSIQVSQEDEFPKWVCKFCQRSLESFHNFYSKVVQIQESLSDMLASIKKSSSSETLKSEVEKIQIIESTIGFGRTKKFRARNRSTEDNTTQGVRRSNRERKAKNWETYFEVASGQPKDTDFNIAIIKEEPEDQLHLEGTVIEVDSLNLPNTMETISVFPKDDDLSSLEDQDWVGQGFNFTSDIDSHGSDNDDTWKPSHSIKTGKTGKSQSEETVKRNSKKRKSTENKNENGNCGDAEPQNGIESNDFSDEDEVQTDPKKPKLRITATHGTMPKPKMPPGTRKAMRAQIHAMMVQFYGYTCDICVNEICRKSVPAEPVKYQSFEALCVHMQTEHNERGYVKCCNCTMRERKRAERHMLLHTQPGSVYKCNICGKQLSSQQSFRCHILLHLPDSERPYQCNQCERGFVTRADLTQHEHQHLPDDKRFSYTCDICGHRFSYESGLVVHKQRVHENIRRHLCDICAKSFNSRSDMERHKEQIHGNVKREQCNECGKWFKGKSILKTHMRRHRGAQYECQYCEKKYAVRSSYKAHLLRHSDEKPHQCPVCEKSFKLPGTLKMHLNQHTGDLPYSCPFCPKKFASSGNYYTHRKRMHREEVAQMKEATEAALAANNGVPLNPSPAPATHRLSDALAKAKVVAECMFGATEVPHIGEEATPSASSNTPACIVPNPNAVPNSDVVRPAKIIHSSSTMVPGSNANNSVGVSVSPVSVAISHGSNGTLLMTRVASNVNLTSVPVASIGSIIPNIQVVPNMSMKPLSTELCPTTGFQVVAQGVHVMHPVSAQSLLCPQMKPHQEGNMNASLQESGNSLPQQVEVLNADLNLLPSAVN